MTIIQHKRGLSTNWAASDPILSVSEIGYEIDTGNFKIGDGVNSWSALPYFQAGSTGSSGTGSGSGTVTSVDLSVPLGLVVSNNPITEAGTLTVDYDTGYAIPTTAKQTEWDTAYGWGDHSAAGYLTSLGIGSSTQAWDADLDAIAALTADGVLRKTSGTWAMDSSTYTETDTLSSVTGRGATTNTAISITNATSSTNTTTGALKVTGGVGIVENLNVGGNTIVTGDLTVSGTTTLSSTIVSTNDPIFTLGGTTAPGSDDNKDRGIAFRWHNGATAKIGFFGFDDSLQQFTFVPDATITNEVVSGATGTLALNVNGNATSADTLSTARNIWGQSFNGSGDVTGSLTSVSDITSSDAIFSLATTAVTTATGNRIEITGGTTNNNIGTGGSVSLTGGSATASSGSVFGGNINIAAGASTTSTSGTGGSVSILAGNGNTKGTISIGTSNTSGITIGAAGITTTIAGTLSATLNALTISSPLSGTSYNGSSAVTLALSSGYGDTQNPYAAKAIKTFLAGPAGGVSGSPTFRLLETTDIPDLSGTYLTTSGTASNSTNINISTTTGNTSDTTLYPVFVSANTTGAQAPHTDIAGIVYNASTDSLSLTGDITITGGDVVLGAAGTASTIKTLATAGASSGSLTISTGDTTTSGTSGNISIDVGNGASSEGTISIGNTYASALTIGRVGVTTTINGTLSASSIAASSLTGTIPSTVLGNSTLYVGTTAIALNRATANQSLTGITSVIGGTGTTAIDISSATTSGIASGAVTISSGEATSSTAGTVKIDSGNNGTPGSGGANVGVGTVNASSVTLGRSAITASIPGKLNLSGSASELQVQGSAGAAGTVLTSAGTGATPTWATPGTTPVIKVAANRTTTVGGTALAINTQETATTVTFPVGRFSVTPSIVAATSSPRYIAAVASASSTGFTLTVRNVSDATGTTYTWNYQAIEIVAGMGN